MNKNENKYFNTAKKMNDALIKLLETKDYEYITIKEICRIASVNRSTFYLHYENMNDLLEETIRSLNSSFNLHFKSKENENTIIFKDNLEDLLLINDENLIPYLNFIKENKNIYKVLKNHPELFNANKTYEEMFRKIFVPIMKRFGLDEKWHKYLMDFYISGLTSIILDWVYDDCKIPVQEVSDFIKGLIVKK
ncbi:MAG: TetR/AcrR family transcriptional regulator [Candidatus Onthovivens sp.]